MTEQPLKLNIGGGETELEGFTVVDRRNGQEAFPLPYEDESVDEIYASHVLEHFGFQESFAALQDWARVLKPGGRMRIAVPDFKFISDQYLKADGNGQSELLLRYAYGGQTDENDFHKCGWDEKRLHEAMKAVGIGFVRRWQSDIPDCASLPVSLNLEGIKSQPRNLELPKIMGIMSTAKLGFTENLFCAMKVLTERRINIIKHTGAYWGQCMERVMQDAIDQGAEWILTLDYDTVFTNEQFERLCYEFLTHPEADAIAPWQAKREHDVPLAWFHDENGNPRMEIPLSEFEPDVVKCANAHFGLTLFRAESIKKMEHPWFWAQPNKDGDWGEGRLDDDIYFWHKWAEVGNTLYLANRVTIGHLQQMVTWVGEDCMPVHQYITEFQQNGPPKEARS